MAKKTPAPKNTNATKKQQTRMTGKEFDRPGRIEEIDIAAEAFRKARDKRQAATKVETAKKIELKAIMKRYGLKDSYFYDDEDGDTEEVKPDFPDPEDFDVKVNKVKQAKAKADE